MSPARGSRKTMSPAFKSLKAKDLSHLRGHRGHKCPKLPIGGFLSIEHVSAGCPYVPYVPCSPISPCCRSPLDPIQWIAPCSAGAALLATEALSCASQGAGCHMIPDRGREAATVPSRTSERARARKGTAARQQAGGRADDVRAEPVPVAPAAAETREVDPWNMRLDDGKRLDLPQLQQSRHKSLLTSRDGLGIRPVITSYRRRPGGGGGRGSTTRKSGTGQPPPQKISEMAAWVSECQKILHHSTPFTWSHRASGPVEQTQSCCDIDWRFPGVVVVGGHVEGRMRFAGDVGWDRAEHREYVHWPARSVGSIPGIFIYRSDLLSFPSSEKKLLSARAATSL